MSERAWRQLLREAIVEAPRTAAQDAIVRLAVSMYVADPRATLTPHDRETWGKRLAEQDAQGRFLPLTAHERAQIRAPLLAYLREQRPARQQRGPSLLEIVAQQFLEDR